MATLTQDQILEAIDGMTILELSEFIKAFEERYGVKTELWRSSSDRVVQRAVAEARAGRFTCDVVETNGPEMEACFREGLLEQFHSPHFTDLVPAAFPEHRHYVADRFNFFTIAYNTNLVQPSEVPGSYDDLLHPRFVGRLGLEAGGILDEFQSFCLAEERTGLPGIEAFLATLESYQHPDRDTDQWPMENGHG